MTGIPGSTSGVLPPRPPGSFSGLGDASYLVTGDANHAHVQLSRVCTARIVSVPGLPVRGRTHKPLPCARPALYFENVGVDGFRRPDARRKRWELPRFPGWRRPDSLRSGQSCAAQNCAAPKPNQTYPQNGCQPERVPSIFEGLHTFSQWNACHPSTPHCRAEILQAVLCIREMYHRAVSLVTSSRDHSHTQVVR